MAVLIDILGATLIGLAITLMIVNFNLSSSGYKIQSDLDLQVVENAQSLSELLNFDMRKIGYLVADSNKILQANTRNIKYLADIDSNGTVDTVSYYLGDSLDAGFTTNPYDKELMRKVNSTILKGSTFGLTDLIFTYRDGNGNITTNTQSIKSIKTEIWIQSLYPYENRYSNTYWELTISPRNL